jgi:hypothetical protein
MNIVPLLWCAFEVGLREGIQEDHKFETEKTKVWLQG